MRRSAVPQMGQRKPDSELKSGRPGTPEKLAYQRQNYAERKAAGTLKKRDPEKVRASNAKQLARPGKREEAKLRTQTWRNEDPERARKSSHDSYWNHHEKRKAANREYHAENREERNAQSRLRARTHREEANATLIRWRKKNPERQNMLGRIANYLRRARIHAAPGYATPDQIAARVEFFGRRCAYCGGPFEHVDHVIPISRGGSNWPANLRPACQPCNRSKWNKLLSEWEGPPHKRM